jgi:hypothetical protein
MLSVPDATPCPPAGRRPLAGTASQTMALQSCHRAEVLSNFGTTTGYRFVFAVQINRVATVRTMGATLKACGHARAAQQRVHDGDEGRLCVPLNAKIQRIELTNSVCAVSERCQRIIALFTDLKSFLHGRCRWTCRLGDSHCTAYEFVTVHVWEDLWHHS